MFRRFMTNRWFVFALQIPLSFGLLWAAGFFSRELLSQANDLWQFLPPAMYQRHGLSALIEFIQQPPLLSALEFPLSFSLYPDVWLKTIFCSIMVSNIYLIYAITLELNINPIFSFAFLLSPAFYLYYTFFYEPVFGMTMMNVLLLGFLRARKGPVLSLAAMALLSMLYSALSPIFMIVYAIFCKISVYRKCNWERYTVVAAIVFAIPLGVIVKNFAVAGVFGTSTWAGCNFSQKWPVRDAYYNKGFNFVPESIPSRGEVLGSQYFNIDARINYNNLNFAKYCAGSLRQISYEMMHDPARIKSYAAGVVVSFVRHQERLSSDYMVAGINVFCEQTTCGYFRPIVRSIYTSRGRIIVEVILVIWSVMGPLAAIVSTRSDWRICGVFIAMATLYYFSLVTNHLFNGGEQERMAYKYSYFMYLAFIVSAMAAYRRFRVQGLGLGDPLGADALPESGGAARAPAET